jgi:ATP-GRASP peptide maturase of grasp-with-spasm system
MILILSVDTEASTDLVIQWLKYYNHPYRRINAGDFVKGELFFDVSKKEFRINGNRLVLGDIGAVWLRKFYGFRSIRHFRKFREMQITPADLLEKEYHIFFDLLFYLLEEKNWLVHYRSISLNKPVVLAKALAAGLRVPETFITNSLKETSERLSTASHITKTMEESAMLVDREQRAYSTLTEVIQPEDILRLPAKFSASMVQRQIEKQFELRIFYCNGKFYSMAIFSQMDEQTKVDFRNYNADRPTRFTPYQLPGDVEDKLRQLFYSLSLNCGSVDMICSPTGELYFLEINPAGQFGMIEGACNYPLHKIVAETLIEMDQSK